jgi:ketosteroid isomerase-like protein
VGATLRPTKNSLIIAMKKILSVLLFATWALAGLALAQTSPSTTPAAKAEKPSKPAALEAQLIALEKGTWEAARRQDANAFAAVCLDDCVEIYGDGTVLPIKEVLAQVPDTVIGEYKIEDIAVTFPVKKTALVRYKVWAKMSYKGQATPPQWVYATAVWVKKDGAWKAAFYQETPLPKQ